MSLRKPPPQTETTKTQILFQQGTLSVLNENLPPQAHVFEPESSVDDAVWKVIKPLGGGTKWVAIH